MIVVRVDCRACQAAPATHRLTHVEFGVHLCDTCLTEFLAMRHRLDRLEVRQPAILVERVRDYVPIGAWSSVRAS